MTNKMRTVKINLLILSAAALFSGCVPLSYFGNGYHGIESSYMSKPFYDSLTRSSVNLQGNLNLTSGYNSDDHNNSFDLLIYGSHGFKYFSIAYGVFGFAGNYKVGEYHNDAISDYFQTSQSYGGFGARISANLNIPLGKVNFKPFGGELIINKEYGDYHNFMKDITGSSEDIFVAEDNLSVNLGITSEILIHPKPGHDIGFRLFLGIPDKDYEGIYSKVLSQDEQSGEASLKSASFTGFFKFNRTNFQIQIGISGAQTWFRFGLGFTLWSSQKSRV